MEVLVGLIGVFVGALLSAFFSRRESERQTRVSNTLKMYERFQSILPSRILADRFLEENFSLGTPLTYKELKNSLQPEDWQHISTTRHIFTELGLLKRSGYLDTKLAKILFASTFRHWYETHFLRMEVQPLTENPDPIKWAVHPDELASWLLN